MNTERIGQAAGAIWKKLHTKGLDGVSFADLKKLPGFTPEEAMAGLGWLAREGKLCFKSEGKRSSVSLVEEEIFAGV
jgi:hypothetical protein